MGEAVNDLLCLKAANLVLAPESIKAHFVFYISKFVGASNETNDSSLSDRTLRLPAFPSALFGFGDLAIPSFSTSLPSPGYHLVSSVRHHTSSYHVSSTASHLGVFAHSF